MIQDGKVSADTAHTLQSTLASKYLLWTCFPADVYCALFKRGVPSPQQPYKPSHLQNGIWEREQENTRFFFPDFAQILVKSSLTNGLKIATPLYPAPPTLHAPDLLSCFISSHSTPEHLSTLYFHLCVIYLCLLRLGYQAHEGRYLVCFVHSCIPST